VAQQTTKFIQIAATSINSDSAQLITQLFALDEDGTVWTYHFAARGGQQENWSRLKTERK